MDGAESCEVTFSNVFNTVEYVLMVVVIDGSEVSLYRNGGSKGSAACPIQVGLSSGGLQIGRNNFAGVVRSFAFWDRALDLNEIKDLDPQNLIC